MTSNGTNGTPPHPPANLGLFKSPSHDPNANRPRWLL